MAFTQSTFAPIGGQATESPSIYSYRTSDPLVDVQATGYFIDKQFQLEENDLIFAITSTGYFSLQIGSDTSTATSIAIGGGFQNIIDVTSTFSASITDDVLICVGTFTVTLPLISTAVKQITIRAGVASTITLVASGGDTVEASATPVTANTSVTLVPTSSGGWLII